MTISLLRDVVRTPGAWQFAKSCVIRNHTNKLQGYRCYHGVNHINREAALKGVFNPMNWNKKRKSGTPVWRQISIHSGLNKEGSMEDRMTEPTNFAHIGEGNNEIDGAEAMMASPYLNDVVKDSKDVSGDSSTASVAHNGVQEAEKMTLSKKKHAVSVEVGTYAMRFLKGKDGSTHEDIKDMGVDIIFPKFIKGNKRSGSIVIEGDSMDNVTIASQKIQSMIVEAATSPAFAYSHFISFPLAIHPEFVDKVTRFQSSVLGYDILKDVNENSRAGTSGNASKVGQREKDLSVGVKLDVRSIPTVSYAPKETKSETLYDLRIDDSIFLKPQRIHLTILMLKLWNTERIHAATKVLQDVCSKVNEVLDNRPLFVRLKGLDVLRGSKAKAQVLYAPIEEVGDEGRLERACQIITDAYAEAGLIIGKDPHNKLKLHATLMNTTFRRGRRDKRGDSFDARGILKQFESEEWGEYDIREAHLSQRFVYDDNGYYHCCASIPFPGSIAKSPQAELEETPMADSA